MKLGLLVGAIAVFGARGSAIADDGPAHRDAFAAAWRDARACLVGAAPWAADADRAREVQIALGVGDCAPKLDRAVAIAREGVELDAGYHGAWFDVARATAELRLRFYKHLLEAVDAVVGKVGAPPPPALATIPTLVPDPATIIPGTKGATDDTNLTSPVDHQVRIDLDYDHPAFTGPIAPPLAWSARIVRGRVIVGSRDLAAGEDVLTTFEQGAERAVVIFAKGDVAIVRSHDGGVRWDAAQPVLHRAVNAGALDFHRRGVGPALDITWTKSDRETIWQAIEGPGALPPARSIPIGRLATQPGLESACFTGGALWWISDHPSKVGVTDERGTQIVAPTLDGPWLAACANGRAVIGTWKGFASCDSHGCAPLVGTMGLADLDAGGRVLYVAHDEKHALHVIGPTATTPARVVRVAGSVVGLVARDDKPVLLVVTPDGIAQVQP